VETLDATFVVIGKARELLDLQARRAAREAEEAEEAEE